MESSSKVTIAAIEGYALGGCELVLACDIRISTNNAKFEFSELNSGVLPDAGGTQRLSRIIGKGRTLDMILTGKIEEGEEAERIGLISYLTSNKELGETIEQVTKYVNKKGSIVIDLTKNVIHKGYNIDESAALWIEKLSQAVVFGTEDKQEGISAFLEKRQAKFTNT